MNKSKKPEVSPQKLREACLKYLEKQRDPSNDHTENDHNQSKQIKKSTSFQMPLTKHERAAVLAKQFYEHPDSQKFEKKEKEDRGLKRTKTINESERIKAIITKDRIVLTERRHSKKQANLSRLSEDENSKDHEEHRFQGLANDSTFKWKEIQEVQKSVGEIQQKLNKVERFMSSLSPESRKRRSRLLASNFAENLAKSGALKLQYAVVDKMEADKIKQFEKYAKNIQVNEQVKNRMIEKMRQEVEEIALMERDQKRAFASAKRSQSTIKGRNLEKPVNIEFRRMHIGGISEANTYRRIEPINRGEESQSQTERAYSFKEYHKEYQKRKNVVEKYHGRKKEEFDPPAEDKYEVSISGNNMEKQTQESDYNSVSKRRRRKKSTEEQSSENQVESGQSSQREVMNSTKTSMSQATKEPSPKAASNEKKKSRRQYSQIPSKTSYEYDETLKTITLKIPQSRRPWNSPERQSSDITQSSNSQDESSRLPLTGQSVQMSIAKSQNYIPQLASFLPNKNQKISDDDSSVVENGNNNQKFEGIKIDVAQIEGKVRKVDAKKDNLKSGQDFISDNRSSD